MTQQNAKIRKTKTTNARRLDIKSDILISQLNGMLAEEKQRAFEIGDLVNQLKNDHGIKVKVIANQLGASRQRLGELRRTAEAFPSPNRQYGVDFHFYTIAARAAKRLGIKPVDALRDILQNGLDTTRIATEFLAAKIRAKENSQTAQQAGLLIARDGELVDRCHHSDFRDVVVRLTDGSVKLVVADPPYANYGCYTDGHHTTASATKRSCDTMSNEDARQAMVDLLKLTKTKMTKGGCLILFRPGGHADPVWLMNAIEEHGWVCHRALAWDKAKTKLGRGNEPYGITTERILVLARQGDTLANHDNSNRSDILSFKPIQPKYSSKTQHHLFEKPIALMEFLIRKHSYEGELILEPFGGTGPASQAAIHLNRHWIYCETNIENFQLGATRIAQIVQKNNDAVG